MKADELYDRLISPIEDQMKGIVGRILRDPEEAADVFQEVMVLIWDKLEYIDRHPNPHGYIIRICITRSYDALRKRMRKRRWELHLDLIKEKLFHVQPPESYIDLDLPAVVRQAVAMLPQKQGHAVLLRILENLSYHSMGGILGCSEATARSHFSKGKARLIKIIEDLAMSPH
jgi:RNA polymerase sigma factor (sigma-70 family)